jgi:NADH:ubiquinone oxidoreductase subunit 5 (subunit L)/multisubunit Na+/H+ antiporter MnhA subunit
MIARTVLVADFWAGCCSSIGRVQTNARKLVLPAVLLGLLLVAVAIVYFVTTAHSLPSFFPGHVSASSSEATHHHTKHGIAALVVALACFAFAWFQSGPRTTGTEPPATA